MVLHIHQRSIIFFCSNSLTDLIEDAGLMHLINSCSNHDPVYCTLSVNVDLHSTFNNEVNIYPTLLWKKATSFQKLDYKNTLSNKLLDCSDLPDELNCNDVLCLNQNHLS